MPEVHYFLVCFARLWIIAAVIDSRYCRIVACLAMHGLAAAGDPADSRFLQRGGRRLREATHSQAPSPRISIVPHAWHVASTRLTVRKGPNGNRLDP
jgi:hypothetical protein